MITDDHVRIDEDGHLTTVTLDRPGTRNACSMNMWLAIRDAFHEIPGTGASCVVLTGANGDFCSGVDVVKKGADEGREGDKLTAMRRLAESVMAVHDCPVPVIVKNPTLETEAIAQNVDLGTHDMAEAMKAFAEKRTPVFEGR